jgi:hypothetical protein
MTRVVRMLPALAIVAAVLAAGRGDAALPARAVPTKPISIEFTDIGDDVFNALVKIAREADIGILWVGDQGRNLPVFAILKDVPADEAIALIAHEAGLTVEPIGGTLVVKAAPPSPPAGYGRYGGYGGYGGYGYGNSASGVPYDLTSPGDWAAMLPLIDLSVQGASIADAVAALNKQIKDWGWQIVVDGAVPKDTTINAKVYKLPLREVLRMMLSQTGLTMTMEVNLADQGSEWPKGVRVIHIVPQPSLQAVGAGGLSDIFPSAPAGVWQPPPPAPPSPPPGGPADGGAR